MAIDDNCFSVVLSQEASSPLQRVLTQAPVLCLGGQPSLAILNIIKLFPVIVTIVAIRRFSNWLHADSPPVEVLRLNQPLEAGLQLQAI